MRNYKLLLVFVLVFAFVMPAFAQDATPADDGAGYDDGLRRTDQPTRDRQSRRDLRFERCGVGLWTVAEGSGRTGCPADQRLALPRRRHDAGGSV